MNVDGSVKSASRSRFASLLSGDTGFDIYTRAVSDVYQDLFGEGIFAGKGIYEVETFQKVLEHRFPCKRLLSRRRKAAQPAPAMASRSQIPTVLLGQLIPH